MAEWLAVIAIMAAFWAIVRGFQRGAQSAGHLYREAKTRLTKDAVSDGHGRFARSSGRNAGYAAAATVKGSRIVLAAIARGLKEGWQKGWQKGHDRRAHTTNYNQNSADPDPDPVTGRGATVDADTTPAPLPRTKPDLGWMGAYSPRGARATAMKRCPWDVGGRACALRLSPAVGARFCVPHERLYRYEFGCQLPVAGDICGNLPADMTPRGMRCTAHAAAAPRPGRAEPADTPMDTTPDNQPEGTTPMTTPTAAPANAETMTVRQLRESLELIAKNARAEVEDAKSEVTRATTDMEDASAALARAAAEAAQMEYAVAHLGSMRLDPQSLGEVQSVQAACVDELTAATTRHNAADMRLASAKARVSGSEARASLAETTAVNVWARHGRSQEAAEEAPVAVADGGAYNTP